ncbi:DNA polymerase III subunit alpha [Niabella ginsenosidivorans]|uniref:DNA polymerase III subunit alpha n=1 Tax=Niabella ginsenosidivorans TaxID=1176587 RepID=A0A1A9I3U2_9BACT|nr:DNA polymerase III subunit alpha [Niabella ginsenosidivorans]ANH81985.1 DNA polymerase III subunit alpha [Niabella ginsenosidivorans]
MKFSHLHVHTQYSLLDGAAPISSLYKKAIADGMPALAISDHGNMFGVFQFVAEAYKHLDENGKPKVKPVVGCEFYIVENRHEKTFTKEKKDRRYHQILLAKNETGYKNLVKLTSLGFIEGLYGKYPRIDKELILQYHEGLIATTCCLGASVPQAILRKGETEGEQEFKWWLDLFGEDFYVELQRHGIGDQDKVNQVLLKWAAKYNVPIIASNDSHYVEQDDFNAHDILLCINTGEKQSTPAFRGDFADDDVNMKNMRFAFANDQFYFKNTEEMSKLFQDIPAAIDNTNAIVDKIELLDLKRNILLPNFPIPDDYKKYTEDEKTDKGIVSADSLNQWEYLRHLTYEGAQKKYGVITDEVKERLDFELFTIKTMGFAGYFLIVSDFIKAGRDNGVFIGPGRGSAAGSVVAYCIGITNIDPIKYDLLFERFLNPDRKSMPDIDTDFDDEGRQKVIDYVVQKYGKNQVAQIITYGTMAAKMSIKDVARVMDLPLAESNALAKLVPEKPGISLKRVLHAPIQPKAGEKSLIEKEGLGADDIENVKKIREIYNGSDLQSKVLHEAEILEGSVRNTGIHAAGIIIAPKDLTELLPVSTAKDSDLWVTQIEGSVIEEAGVIKMDFLGLKTLTIIKDALKLIKQNHGIDIDIDSIPLDDEKTYELYQKGETNATFQFESAGMQKYLRELKPDRFGDLIAMNALYRPGPMAYIPQYVDRKHGREEVTYDLPEMEEYLKDTYGITVYQEQVMLLSQKLAGFSKGDADVLRKAMGKKQKAVLDKMKKQFVEGAAKKGHPAEILEKIWTDWEAFAQYAFNKSHSTCYAFVAYQTAYLKAHYPSEYMAGVLNNAGSLEKITFFMEECKRMGLPVLGPDINESQKGFAVNKKGEIRFGLGGLKGVGEAAVESLIKEREENGNYTSIFDMIKRVNQRTVNKKTLESLAYAGAFDCFKDLHRAQYFYVPQGDTTNGLEKIIKYGQICSAQAQTSTNTLFGDLAEVMEVQVPKIPDCAPWPLVVQLDYEKQVTGIFISGHPLDDYRFEMEHYGISKIAFLNDYRNGEKEKISSAVSFKIMGLVSDAQHRISRSGNKFGSFIIEDYSGKLDLVLFSEDYMKYAPMLQLGATVYITGYFKQRFNGEYDFKIASLCLAESVIKNQTKKLTIELPVEEITKETVQFIQTNIKTHKGPSMLKLSIKDKTEDIQVDLMTQGKGFEMNTELIEYLSKQINWNVAVELN